MSIEFDDEAQAGIDAEEEEAAAAADLTDEEAEHEFHEATVRNEDAASEEEGKMEFLQELERIDRQLQAVEQDKSETMKEFNDQIKALKNRRADTLDSLENYRLGERSLPLE